MRIALILTGGTICSRMIDGARRSDADTALTVLEAKYRADHPYSSVEFDVQMPLDRLSEDLTPDDWCVLLRTLAALDYDALDGVIIAHGTDTLEQTAGMLCAAMHGVQIPVMLVSAIAPLDDPQSNGHANFAAAVRLICRRIPAGVWAVYENSDGEMFLHRGHELLPCQWGSMSFFSAGMQSVAALLEADPEPLPPKKSAPPDVTQCAGALLHTPEVLRIQPYNGLRYDKIALDGVRAVVHGTYHSETANSALYSPYSVQTLLLRCEKAGIPCYLAPCRMTAQSYGSALDLVQAGAVPLEDILLPLAYGAVWFGSLIGLEGERLTAYVRQLRQTLL